MCKWGTSAPLEVTIPAHLSSTGVAKRKIVGVDSCIAPLVKALNDAGISTMASCCGHGHLPPTIAVEWNGDKDRWLVMVSRAEMEQITATYGVNIHGEKRIASYTNAASAVLAERERQKSELRYDETHDDAHTDGDLAQAACAFVSAALHKPIYTSLGPLTMWNSHRSDRTPREKLVQAAALILAEIERIDRAQLRQTGK